MKVCGKVIDGVPCLTWKSDGWYYAIELKLGYLVYAYEMK